MPYYKMQNVRSPWKYDYISFVEFFRDCKKDLFLHETTMLIFITPIIHCALFQVFCAFNALI